MYMFLGMCYRKNLSTFTRKFLWSVELNFQKKEHTGAIRIWYGMFNTIFCWFVFLFSAFLPFTETEKINIHNVLSVATTSSEKMKREAKTHQHYVIRNGIKTPYLNPSSNSTVCNTPPYCRIRKRKKNVTKKTKFPIFTVCVCVCIVDGTVRHWNFVVSVVVVVSPGIEIEWHSDEVKKKTNKKEKYTR